VTAVAPEEDDRFTPDDMPPGMASFTLVILRRPENAPTFTDEELERLQAGHLAHLAHYRDNGSIAAAGPFSDQADPKIRGLELWRLPLDEVRKACAEDPSVQAGRLQKDVMRWWFKETDLPLTPS
jgi:uncharacterized protein